MNAKLGVISEICCTFAMTIYFRFPQNRPYKAVWFFFCYHMQRYINFMTLAIKSLSLFELICDYPYLKINGKVSKDKWQSMFRHLARYVKTLSFPDQMVSCSQCSCAAPAMYIDFIGDKINNLNAARLITLRLKGY